ncbi:MAG: hypothetical protein QXE06_06960 [Candidatus Bathyarchaeia archaeon]
MPGPLKYRRGKWVYHRGKGVYSVYSPKRDKARKSTRRLHHWSPAKRKKYKHTSD